MANERRYPGDEQPEDEIPEEVECISLEGFEVVNEEISCISARSKSNRRKSNGVWTALGAAKAERPTWSWLSTQSGHRKPANAAAKWYGAERDQHAKP